MSVSDGQRSDHVDLAKSHLRTEVGHGSEWYELEKLEPLACRDRAELGRFSWNKLFRNRIKLIEGLRERTEYIDIIISFFRPSLNRVLFRMFCLLVEGEYQILVF